jgi:heme/copper-type cytochrome/quinol oxidase subunit 3
MSDAAQSTWVEIEPKPEPPEQKERNIWASARLLVSSTVFLFLPFVFGYLYLASLNTSGLWRPNDLKAPLGWGIAILLAVVISAGLVAWARSELRAGKDASSRWLSLAALLFGLVAVVLQAIEYTQLDFGPMDGGWASVFVGWTGLFGLVVLFTMIWLEMIVASGFRNGNQALGSSQSDVDAIGFYLTFLAGLGALTFSFLYLL